MRNHRFSRVGASIKAALFANLAAAPNEAAGVDHAHVFGTPLPELPRGELTEQEWKDVEREASLKLPRKQAWREIAEAYIAQRDTCLKACLEDVLGVELTDPATQLEEGQLLEVEAPDRVGKHWLYGGKRLLWISDPPNPSDNGLEARGVWTIQLLRNLPDEAMLGLPAGVRRWDGRL